jgi:hypothetical protein
LHSSTEEKVAGHRGQNRIFSPALVVVLVKGTLKLEFFGKDFFSNI